MEIRGRGIAALVWLAGPNGRLGESSGANRIPDRCVLDWVDFTEEQREFRVVGDRRSRSNCGIGCTWGAWGGDYQYSIQAHWTLDGRVRTGLNEVGARAEVGPRRQSRCCAGGDFRAKRLHTGQLSRRMVRRVSDATGGRPSQRLIRVDWTRHGRRRSKTAAELTDDHQRRWYRGGQAVRQADRQGPRRHRDNDRRPAGQGGIQFGASCRGHNRATSVAPHGHGNAVGRDQGGWRRRQAHALSDSQTRSEEENRCSEYRCLQAGFQIVESHCRSPRGISLRSWN